MLFFDTSTPTEVDIASEAFLNVIEIHNRILNFFLILFYISGISTFRQSPWHILQIIVKLTSAFLHPYLAPYPVVHFQKIVFKRTSGVILDWSGNKPIPFSFSAPEPLVPCQATIGVKYAEIQRGVIKISVIINKLT